MFAVDFGDGLQCCTHPVSSVPSSPRTATRLRLSITASTLARLHPQNRRDQPAPCGRHVWCVIRQSFDQLELQLADLEESAAQAETAARMAAAAEKISVPSLRINIIELCGSYQGVDGGGETTAFIRAGQG